MIRKFKPGDRVLHKSGGPLMIVQRYAYNFKPILGWHQSNHIVECSWYDGHGHHTEQIHQNNLYKLKPSHIRSSQSEYTNNRDHKKVVSCCFEQMQ